MKIATNFIDSLVQAYHHRHVILDVAFFSQRRCVVVDFFEYLFKQFFR